MYFLICKECGKALDATYQDKSKVLFCKRCKKETYHRIRVITLAS